MLELRQVVDLEIIHVELLVRAGQLERLQLRRQLRELEELQCVRVIRGPLVELASFDVSHGVTG